MKRNTMQGSNGTMEACVTYDVTVAGVRIRGLCIEEEWNGLLKLSKYPGGTWVVLIPQKPDIFEVMFSPLNSGGSTTYKDGDVRVLLADPDTMELLTEAIKKEKAKKEKAKDKEKT